MRLWHYKLIPLLPRQLLLNQHRTCCGLRGRGWGKRQRTISYLWNYPFHRLFGYHQLVMTAMRCRGWSVTPAWDGAAYRGRFSGPMPEDWCPPSGVLWEPFAEHDDEYLQECIELVTTKLSATKNGKAIYSAEDVEHWSLGLRKLLK